MRLSHCLASALVLLTASVSANEPVTAPRPFPSESDVREWIGQLAAEDFQERATATMRLLASDPRMLPILEANANDGPLEQRLRLEFVIEQLTRERMDRLIARLDSTNATMSASATRELVALGLPAVSVISGGLSELAYGTQHPDAESLVKRRMAVLEALHKSGDDDVKQSVVDTLFRFASLNHGTQHRSIMLAAYNTLVKVDPAKANDRRVVLARMLAQRGGNFGGRVVGRRVSVRTVNGDRTVTVEENGEKLEFSESKKDGVKLTKTTKKDGKAVTQSWKAKDVEALKKLNPEAAKAYERIEKYAKQGAVVRKFAPAVPANIKPAPVPVAAPNAAKLQKIRDVQAKLKQAADDLRDAAKNGAGPDEMKAHQDRLQALSAEMRDAIRGK